VDRRAARRLHPAAKPVLPVVDDPIFGFRRVNVNAQRRDPASFMNWIARLIRVRRECVEIAWGTVRGAGLRQPRSVLVLQYRFRGIRDRDSPQLQ
jgi:maltose alpha-D-glucosyltransferase / alpha-amylase